MDLLDEEDVPYGNDWDSPVEAAGYGNAADRSRPWRAEIRNYIARRVAEVAPAGRVLELGSGPGLLAECVLHRCPHLQSYTLLDFSAPMLAISRERLRAYPAAAFVQASFKSEEWPRLVRGPFDCVVTMQAVHELRHKRHAQRLYEQVFQILEAPGLFLVCDHTPFGDSPKSTALYMTEGEARHALESAGFADVRVEVARNGLVVYAAEKGVSTGAGS